MASLTENTRKNSIKQLPPWMTGFIESAVWQRARPGWRSLLLITIVGIIFFGFMALVQFASPNLVGTDGYYHIKLASIMRSQGVKIDFPWLPLTILEPEGFYDHHLLFHAALVPFTLGDLRLGAKWASVIFSSLAFLSIWWLLQRQKVPQASLWALGVLAVSESFIYRMSMPRAQSLSLLVLIIGLHWMLSGRTWRLAILGFVYVWLYNAFPLLIVLAGIYGVSVWLSERRLDLRPLFFTSLGIGLGLLINPYFPENLAFIANHLLPKLNDPTSVRVGNEWYPYSTRQLLENSPLALAAFAAGILGLGLQERRLDTRTASAFLIALFFGFMLLISRRFIEYFPPFALIFAALAWAPNLNGVTASQPARKPRLAATLALAGVLGFGLLFTGRQAAASVADTTPYQRYQGAAGWLAHNTPAGSLVFQTDWDDFTRLFFANTHNTYLVGLDPTYLQLADPDLYEAWIDISQGEVEAPSQAIFETFGARYVMTDRSHRDFIRQADRDPQLRAVYKDKEAIIYTIDLE